MSEGRGIHDWGIASSLMALLANLNRAKSSKVIKADDFNPYADNKKDDEVIYVTEENISQLKRAFTGTD